MNLAVYTDVKFEDKEAFEQFSFIHFIAHDTISSYIEDQNLSVTNYPLDNPDAREDWMLAHNQSHIQIAQRLGLTAPQDLELYNLGEPSEFYDWFALHGNEHDRILLAMGF